MVFDGRNHRTNSCSLTVAGRPNQARNADLPGELLKLASVMALQSVFVEIQPGDLALR
jgi:hypothetical protein